MKNTIIGVTPRINHSDNNTFIRVHRNYIDKMTKIGLIPIIITPGSDYQKVLDLCDGFPCLPLVFKFFIYFWKYSIDFNKVKSVFFYSQITCILKLFVV